jgi:signal peptidase I
MGDHRSASADSRAHLGDPGGGTVPINRVIGQVVAVSWPPSDIHVLDSGPTGGDR